MTQDERFLRRAYDLALDAEQSGEVPVGAVLVDSGGVVLAEAFNSPIRLNDPTAHAEMLVLRAAGSKISNYRLPGTTLYVTLEPCAMCAGALIAARVERLVFAARDLRFGGVRSKFRIADSDVLNHRVEVVEGVLGAEVTKLMQRFFAGRR